MRQRSIGFAISRRSGRLVPIALVAFAIAASAAGPTYDQLRSAAIARCDAIDPSASQSGLLFNPDGYRSFYVQSECLQNAAIQFRDEALCSRVRRRWSLFSSSWGITSSRCLQLVRDGAAADRASLEEVKRRDAAGGMNWVDFRIERNGNGRDFVIIPTFRGEYASGYRLTFEILADGDRAPALVHANGYFIDRASNLRLFVRQSEIRQQLPDFTLGRAYTVRASVLLDIGFGGQAGYWSDAFIERTFPARDRTRTMTKQVTF